MLQAGLCRIETEREKLGGKVQLRFVLHTWIADRLGQMAQGIGLLQFPCDIELAHRDIAVQLLQQGTGRTVQAFLPVARTSEDDQ